MMEKRKQQRRHLAFQLNVVDRVTGEELGHIGNISPAGAMIVTEKDLPVDVTYDVKIDLRDLEELGNQDYLETKLQTAWSLPDTNPDLNRVGSRFVDVKEADKYLIYHMINYFGFTY